MGSNLVKLSPPGVLEAEENPEAKPHDTLCNLVTDAQVCSFAHTLLEKDY